MKEIKEIVEHIHKELDAGEELAKHATQYKDIDRTMSDCFFQLSENHLDNVKKLHAQATRLIKDQKERGVEIPTAMLTVWDWEHDKMVSNEAKIRALLSLYREN